MRWLDEKTQQAVVEYHSTEDGEYVWATDRWVRIRRQEPTLDAAGVAAELHDDEVRAVMEDTPGSVELDLEPARRAPGLGAGHRQRLHATRPRRLT